MLGGASAVVAYRLGEATVAVDAGDDECARWLREFFTPWFVSQAAGDTGPRVCMVANAERFMELEARKAKTGTRPVACFSLDSALVSYPSWSEPDGTRVVADGEYGCFYLVRGNQVEVVARPQGR